MKTPKEALVYSRASFGVFVAFIGVGIVAA